MSDNKNKLRWIANAGAMTLTQMAHLFAFAMSRKDLRPGEMSCEVKERQAIGGLEWVLIVRDRGTGLPLDDMPPHRRESYLRQKYTIETKMRGKFFYDAVLGQGARITITIPVFESPAQAQEFMMKKGV